jgi:hypothetical protein
VNSLVASQSLEPLKPYKTKKMGPRKTKPSPFYCHACSEVATTEAFFRMTDVIVMKRFCDQCLSNLSHFSEGQS